MAPQEFTVINEELYYPRMLEQILGDKGKLSETVFALGESITGNVNGKLCCEALWEMETWNGILLHRKGEMALWAYLPVVTEAAASVERSLVLKLSLLAEEMGDVPVSLDQSIQPGIQCVQGILRYLSERMDV